MIRRRAFLPSLALVSAAVAVGVLSGCSSPEGEVPVNAETAREQLVAVMNDTADHLGIDGWEPVSGEPRASSCDDGAKFAYAIAVDPRPEHLQDAQRVYDYWTSLGMEVRLVEEPAPTVFASGGTVRGLTFQTAPGLYAVTGTSLCGEGDPRELNGASSDSE
jgi:hypothetical protein